MAEKKYVIDNAELMAEWNWEKNNSMGLNPQLLTIGCHTKAWWICEKGHSYEAQIRNRVNGNGCSYCAGKKVMRGYNDLETFYPQVAAEWNYERNGDLSPQTVAFASNKKVWWRCKKCGGEYDAYIANRTLRGSSCPYCAGQKVLIGYNDLLSQSPGLAGEWSERNTIKPVDVTVFSKKKVYWICPLGHNDYLMSIQSRSNRQGCPICAQQSQTSFPEQAIFYYLKQAFPDAINRYIFEKKEIDTFLPSKNIGIEYNGYFSHRDKAKKDELKKIFFKSLGIKLIAIKEYKYSQEQTNADFYINERFSYSDLNTLITELLRFLCIETVVDVNCERDTIAIKEQYVVRRKENSIAKLLPDLAKEWDYERNGRITPIMVAASSKLKFYWKCPLCGNSYQATPQSRRNGIACRFCSKSTYTKRPPRDLFKKGVNDVETKHPELLVYWDYKRNQEVPSETYCVGEKKIFWLCERGHSFSRTIRDFIHNQGCPICNGKKVLAGFNDLLSQKPELAAEWDYELNDCLPNEIYYANQSKDVHWICKICGHKWMSKVKQRKNCPECERKRLQINVYDATTGAFLYSFANARILCDYFGLDINKQRGNISMICSRQQKTLMGKYILRHANDDEYDK